MTNERVDHLYSAGPIRKGEEVTSIPLTKQENMIVDRSGTHFKINGFDGMYVPLRKATPFCGFGGFATFKHSKKATNCAIEQVTVPKVQDQSVASMPYLILKASKDIPPMCEIVVSHPHGFVVTRPRVTKQCTVSRPPPVDGSLQTISDSLLSARK